MRCSAHHHKIDLKYRNVSIAKYEEHVYRVTARSHAHTGKGVGGRLGEGRRDWRTVRQAGREMNGLPSTFR